MFKFFRKYNKIILVVGGSILMVLFLLPAGISRMLGGGLSTPVARIDGRKISVGEMNEMGRELQVVGALAPELLQIIGVDPRGPEHWLLLSEAARRAGLVGGPSDGAGFIPEISETAVELTLYMIAQQNPEQAAQLRSRRDDVLKGQIANKEAMRTQLIQNGMPAEKVDKILADARGVLRMLELNNTASLYSTRAAQLMGKQLADYAGIHFVNIPAASAAVGIELTPEELEAHFEQYKSVDPATDPFGIGYLQPNQISLEWLTVDRVAIESRLVLDPIEVNKYWRQNRAQFPGEFAESRQAVEAAYRGIRANQVSERIAELIRRRMYASTASLPGTSRYKELPADWETRQPSLVDLAAELDKSIVEEFKLADGLRVISHGGPLRRQSAQSLGSLAGIGQASMRMNDSQTITFPQYAMSVRELAGENQLGVQTGLVYGPVQSPNLSQYYFRIIGVRPSGPPDSLDEVKTQAQPNLRLLMGMEKLKAEAEEYRQRAISGGLAPLASAPGAAFVVDVEVTRQTVRHASTQEIFPLLNVPEFRDPIMDSAEKIDPTVDIEQVPKEQRILAIPVPSAKALLMVEIRSFRPMTIERFRQLGIPIRYLANSEEVSGSPFEAFTFDRLAERLKFERIGAVERSEESGTEGAGDSDAG
jgi:hypothetical protein